MARAFCVLLIFSRTRHGPCSVQMSGSAIMSFQVIQRDRPKTAKPEQIKRAYRMLVKRFHPDLFPSGSDTQFEAVVRIRQINAAYGILSNPQKRSTYDARTTKRRSPYAEPKPEYCDKCGKPTLYWQIDRDVPLCNDCRRSPLSRY
jgi:hypothetical protein